MNLRDSLREHRSLISIVAIILIFFLASSWYICSTNIINYEFPKGGIEPIIFLFLIFYIFAVIVERLIEFVSLIPYFSTNKEEIESYKRKIANYQGLSEGVIKLVPANKNIENSEPANKKNMENLESRIKSCEKITDNLEINIKSCEKKKRTEEKKRVFLLWFSGLAFSLVISAILNGTFKIELLGVIGLNLGKFDAFMSALIISMGTKPVHDIILLLEKGKKK